MRQVMILMCVCVRVHVRVCVLLCCISIAIKCIAMMPNHRLKRESKKVNPGGVQNNQNRTCGVQNNQIG